MEVTGQRQTPAALLLGNESPIRSCVGPRFSLHGRGEKMNVCHLPGTEKPAITTSFAVPVFINIVTFLTYFGYVQEVLNSDIGPVSSLQIAQ
jgi:hypothetical protein